MKALIGGIQKFSTGDGPGIRTTVFLKGCPLQCSWCHNPELIKFENQLMYNPQRCIGCGACVRTCPAGAVSFDIEGKYQRQKERCKICLLCTENCYAQALTVSAKEMALEDIMKMVIQDKGYYDVTGGGMTISGGECLSHGHFSLALAKEAKAQSINIAIETSGMGDYDILLKLCKNVDYILYDIKSVDDSIHKKYTGTSNILILDNLRKIAAIPSLNSKIQIRMPLMHRVNDTDQIISETISFLLENGLTDVALLPYHDFGISKSTNMGLGFTRFVTPPDEWLCRIWEKFTQAGLKAEISGRDLRKIKN